MIHESGGSVEDRQGWETSRGELRVWTNKPSMALILQWERELECEQAIGERVNVRRVELDEKDRK
jgi:hypothetical protein